MYGEVHHREAVLTVQDSPSIATEWRESVSDVLQRSRAEAARQSAIRSLEIWYVTEAISGSISAEAR